MWRRSRYAHGAVLFGHGTAPPQPLKDNRQRDARRDRYGRGTGLQQQSRCQNAGADQVLPAHFQTTPARINPSITDNSSVGRGESIPGALWTITS